MSSGTTRQSPTLSGETARDASHWHGQGAWICVVCIGLRIVNEDACRSVSNVAKTANGDGGSSREMSMRLPAVLSSLLTRQGTKTWENFRGRAK